MERECHKMKFASRAEAKAWHRSRSGERSLKGASGSAYECSVCPAGTWHWTSQSKAEARRKAKAYERRYRP